MQNKELHKTKSQAVYLHIVIYYFDINQCQQ